MEHATAAVNFFMSRSERSGVVSAAGPNLELELELLNGKLFSRFQDDRERS